MSRIQALLGGVLAATAAIYYNSDDFRHSSDFVAKTVRETEQLIDNQLPASLEPKQAPRSLEFTYRPSIRETIADLWDEQVLKLASAAYSLDFTKESSQLIQALQNKIGELSK